MCYLDFNPQRTAVIQFDFLRSENIINAEGYHVAENALRDDRDTFLHTHDFFEIFVMLVNYSGEPRPIEATRKVTTILSEPTARPAILFPTAAKANPWQLPE